MTSQKLNELREAIALICPETVSEEAIPCKIAGCCVYHYRTINKDVFLHHVLRAIKASGKAIKVNENGRMQLEEPIKYTAATEKKAGTFPTHWVGCDWNLARPSLDEQEPVVIDFLHSIICKK